MKKQDEVLINSRGKEIPLDMVRPDHYRKHKLVHKIFQRGKKLEEQIAKSKAKISAEINKYQRWLEKYYGGTAEFKNLILSDYPKEIQVEIKSARIIEFDEKIQLAESLLKKLISGWTKGTNKHLTVLIDEAFKTDKKGFLDKHRILSLQQYKIDDPDWQKAMLLIGDSINVVDRKSYMNIKYKDASGKWKCLNLNFSSAEVE